MSSPVNRGNMQKRLREPTGSSGPGNNSAAEPAGAGAVAAPQWGENALQPPPPPPPPPPQRDPQSGPEGTATQNPAAAGTAAAFFSLSTPYGQEELNPVVRIGQQVPQRPFSAFPLPSAPLFSAPAFASAPLTSLNPQGGGGWGADRTEHSFSSFPLSQGPAATTAMAVSSTHSPNTTLQNGSKQVQEDSVGSHPSSCSANSQSKTMASSSSSSSSAASSSCSDGDDESDTNEQSERGIREDRLKRYPRFTTEYAVKCKGDLIPFLRELFVPLRGPSPAYHHHDPMNHGTDARPSPPPPPQQRHQFISRFILYGKYIYHRTLGKGTYSKVVLGEELDHATSIQQQQLFSGGDALTPTVTCFRGAGGPQVALKIFRDSDVYREACWDEYSILSALCSPMPGGASGDAAVSAAPPALSVPQLLTTVRTAPSHTGSMDYYGSVGRFMTPIDYIPHPLHPAVVYPVMGPSLLHVVRSIKKASKDLCASAKYPTISVPRTIGGDSIPRHGRSSEDEARSLSPPLHGKNRVWFRGLPLSLLRVALYQILLFLKFAHERGLVHTDLKPENILFETDLALPALVSVYCKCLDRPNSSDSATAGRPTAASLESMKRLNDSHKLTSASGTASHHTGPLPSVPCDDTIAWKQPPLTGPGFNTNSTNTTTLMHTVSVRLPLLNSIRVVDLGAAQFLTTFTHKSHLDGVTPVSYDPIQTSHYRSPETLMGTGWTASADIFSLGCMIPELLTGDCLFMPQDTQEHLALMRHVIGPFWASAGRSAGAGGTAVERVFSLNARTFNHYFDASTGALRWPVTAAVLLETAAQQQQQKQQRQLRPLDSRSNENANDDDDDDEPPLDPFKATCEEDEAFVRTKPTLEEILGSQPLLLDLCQRMLRYNPLERITAAEALDHPFFHRS